MAQGVYRAGTYTTPSAQAAHAAYTARQAAPTPAAKQAISSPTTISQAYVSRQYVTPTGTVRTSDPSYVPPIGSTEVSLQQYQQVTQQVQAGAKTLAAAEKAGIKMPSIQSALEGEGQTLKEQLATETVDTLAGREAQRKKEELKAKKELISPFKEEYASAFEEPYKAYQREPLTKTPSGFFIGGLPISLPKKDKEKEKIIITPISIKKENGLEDSSKIFTGKLYSAAPPELVTATRKHTGLFYELKESFKEGIQISPITSEEGKVYTPTMASIKLLAHTAGVAAAIYTAAKVAPPVI